MMRCLSICQPFAELIVSGRKTIELRRWSTRYRGEFLIHAPVNIRVADCRRLGIETDLPTSAIVGKAEIYGIRVYRSEQEMQADSKRHLAGKFAARYGFLLRNAMRLRIPIPLKGRLGLFEVDLPPASIDPSALTAEIIDDEHRYRLVGMH